MNRRRGWILVVLGLVMALGAGGLVFYVLQEQATATEQAQQALLAATPRPTKSLPVAAKRLEVGAKLTAADYTLRDFPEELVPASAITETAQLEGKALARAVNEGETFNSEQFLGEQAATVSQQLEPGNVVFAFPVGDLMSQSNQVNDGDHLDLLLTLQIQNPDGQATGKSTAITMQNIRVMKVLRPSENNNEPSKAPPTALLLSMKPEDAVMVKFIKDSGGVIDFALRSPADKEPFEAQPINQDELVRRYGFR